MKLFVAEKRIEKNMSIRELAAKADILVSHLTEIEAARVNPSIDVMCKLAKALNVPVHELFSCE